MSLKLKSVVLVVKSINEMNDQMNERIIERMHEKTNE